MLVAVILWFVLGGALFLAIALIAMETDEAKRQGQRHPHAEMKRSTE